MKKLSPLRLSSLVPYLSCFLFLISYFSQAQQFTISGYVKDSKNGEAIIGASVYKLGTTTGVATNAYGFYSLSLPQGKHQIAFAYIGYPTLIKEVDLTKNVLINMEMGQQDSTLAEVVISS